ncbi:hypothetical protein VFMJ11_A0653 [Aliivibrio fischeri MJ11]|uniref:Uncharacterized protein n=1 Tax=Aliivibrio fischeri (strain MJ11) TaxID=388396 RepID=B5EU34_ALIFM|nr:hypothetical protein VFMJ11_A0653 [Aliivibrio fischeri MJ11]
MENIGQAVLYQVGQAERESAQQSHQHDLLHSAFWVYLGFRD